MGDIWELLLHGILIIKLNIKLFHLACLVNKLYKIIGDFTIINKKYP